MATSTDALLGIWTTDPGLFRCPTCHGELFAEDAALACTGCSQRYPLRDGLLFVKEEPTADNKIARDFYNSTLWPKFRFWERFFWFCNGGENR